MLNFCSWVGKRFWGWCFCGKKWATSVIWWSNGGITPNRYHHNDCLHCNIMTSNPLKSRSLYPSGLNFYQIMPSLQAMHRSYVSQSPWKGSVTYFDIFDVFLSQVISKHVDSYAIEQGEGRRWNDVRLTIPPYIPESSLEGCDIIDLQYSLLFQVELDYNPKK